MQAQPFVQIQGSANGVGANPQATRTQAMQVGPMIYPVAASPVQTAVHAGGGVQWSPGLTQQPGYITVHSNQVISPNALGKEPLLATVEHGQVQKPRLWRINTENHEAFDKKLKDWDEQYDDNKYFYGFITALFFTSSIFAADWTSLYAHTPTGAITWGKALSSYVKFIPLAWVLRTVANVRLLSVLCGGVVVGMFWSIIEENGGENVELTAKSVSCCWAWYHFLIFGLCAVATVWGVKYRIDEVKASGSWKWSEAHDLLWAAAGIVMIVVGTIAGAQFHLHSWFFGFGLTLAAGSLGGPPGFYVKSFGFGLFLHGAACWGINDLFQETVAMTTTTQYPTSDEIEYLPILLVGAVGAFWAAKYKSLI